ncbi:hypothetical protein FOA52_006072 [Chlamydomonas sp. UWO 241]|nr:hypothetical protein FOA52_006072 [Chlamydomonas sp. UWO 241]
MASPEQDTKRQRKEEAGTTPTPLQVEEPSKPSTSLAGVKVQDLMKKYYGRLFPHHHMFRWLSYGNDGKHPQADAGFFQKREFCFTLDGDIFVRYQSFKDGNEMREALKARVPSKIDIGPVYTANPQDRLKFGAGFLPTERELVFDIDLTDYDDVRTCGKGGHICRKCWPLMGVAIQIIDRGLREDFGFRNILWVYSGRRGIHCWVCDPSARKLTDEQRSSIASYFAVYKGHENDRVKIAMGGMGSTLHPSVQAAVDVLKGEWEESLLVSQNLLMDDEMRANVLKYLPDEALQETVRKAWDSNVVPAGARGQDPNVIRWRVLEKEVALKTAEAKAALQKPIQRKLERCVSEIILAFSYPRLDMEVSKKMNHLLKAPFCVHPKTGKVCIPIDPSAAYDFDPESVCTVAGLLEELAGIGAVGDKEEQWQHTALAGSVKLFESTFLDGCLASSRAELAAKARESAAARADMSF